MGKPTHKSDILGIEFEESPEGLMLASLRAEQLGLHQDARDFREAAIEARKAELLRHGTWLAVGAAAVVTVLWKLLSGA
jgi:hypothetical protein